MKDHTVSRRTVQSAAPAGAPATTTPHGLPAAAVARPPAACGVPARTFGGAIDDFRDFSRTLSVRETAAR